MSPYKPESDKTKSQVLHIGLSQKSTGKVSKAPQMVSLPLFLHLLIAKRIEIKKKGELSKNTHFL